MPIKYPAKIDDNISLPDAIDNITPIEAVVVNRLKQAIIAIEEELGVNPSGLFSSIGSRLVDIENSIDNIQVISLNGDLGGSINSVKVVGLRGTPVSSTAPITGQVLTFNGLIWLPADPTGGGGGGSSFTAGGDLSGNSTSQTVIKINGATVPIAGSLTIGNVLSVSNGSTLSYGPLNIAGGANYITGKLPITNLANSISNGDILATIGGVATWTSQASSNFFEIIYVSGLHSTSLATFDRIGARKIDMTSYPPTRNGLSRVVKFVTDMQKTPGATSVEVRLFDVTNGAQVVSNTYSTDATLTSITSGALTVGASSGNIRTDTPTMYEVSMRMNGGATLTDSVYCNNARLVISYA